MDEQLNKPHSSFHACINDTLRICKGHHHRRFGQHNTMTVPSLETCIGTGTTFDAAIKLSAAVAAQQTILGAVCH